MSEQIRVFIPMPGGKPDETVWPELVQEAAQTAHAIAKGHDVRLLAPWHQSSDWGEQDVGGTPTVGWTFFYDTVAV